MFHVHIFLVGGVGNVSSIDMSTIIIIITNGYIVMSWQLFIDGCMCCYVGRKVYNSRVPIYLLIVHIHFIHTTTSAVSGFYSNPENPT